MMQTDAPVSPTAAEDDEWELPDIFDGICVEGGFNGEDDGCEGGACKI